jgi:hypothetical protein
MFVVILLLPPELSEVGVGLTSLISYIVVELKGALIPPQYLLE